MTSAVLVACMLLANDAKAQVEEQTAPTGPAVTIEPIAQDEAIERRISRILDATGWYRGIKVDADEGVVFLDGTANSQEQRSWARDLAARTEGAVAVVNRIEVREEVNWDLAPAWSELETIARRAVVALPLVVLTLMILPLAWWLSNAIASLLRGALATRVQQDFLRSVVARAFSIPILLLGIYLILQVAGLTGLAVSLLGGAGVLGIVLGFAFRDIAENFLASLILSLRRPFRQGDMISVVGFEGVVQTMNTRSTVLLTIDGNHVQIPNATVFKNTIVNYSAAPARRVTAEVGIGYEASIGTAQQVIVDVLRGHEAILDEPPPIVLVDALGSATINLKAHFWIDGRTLSPHRVRSSALRLIKQVLVAHEISMPDEAREVIFPQGVPIVRMNPDRSPIKPIVKRAIQPAHADNATANQAAEATAAEGGLGNEIKSLPSNIASATIPEAAAANLLAEK